MNNSIQYTNKGSHAGMISGSLVAAMLLAAPWEGRAEVYEDDFNSSANAGWWSGDRGFGDGRIVRNPTTLRGQLAYEVTTSDFDLSYRTFEQAQPPADEAWSLSVDVTLPTGADAFIHQDDLVTTEITIRPEGDTGDNELNFWFSRLAFSRGYANSAAVFYRKDDESVDLDDNIATVDDRTIEVQLAWEPDRNLLTAAFASRDGTFELGRFDLSRAQFDWGMRPDDRFEIDLGFVAFKVSSVGQSIAMALLNNRTMSYDNFRLDVEEPSDVLPPEEVSTDRYHPADRDQDWVISINEATGFGGAWKNGRAWDGQPVLIDFVTKAGQIWKSGGNYIDLGGQLPAAWSNR